MLGKVNRKVCWFFVYQFFFRDVWRRGSSSCDTLKLILWKSLSVNISYNEWDKIFRFVSESRKLYSFYHLFQVVGSSEYLEKSYKSWGVCRVNLPLSFPNRFGESKKWGTKEVTLWLTPSNFIRAIVSNVSFMNLLNLLSKILIYFWFPWHCMTINFAVYLCILGKLHFFPN